MKECRVARRHFAQKAFSWDQTVRDYEAVADLLDRFTGSKEETDAYITLLTVQTKQRVERWEAEIEAVAEALLESETLSGKQAKEIIARTYRRRFEKFKSGWRAMWKS